MSTVMSSTGADSGNTEVKEVMEVDNVTLTEANHKAIFAKLPNEKRKDCITSEDCFMGMALLAAQRSRDPCTQVGACIISPDNKIIGIGYNGFPRGCSDDEFPWGKTAPSALDRKELYVCHAEINAILNKNATDIKNCRMFVALFPCNECAKIIIQSGISEVIYLSNKNWHKEKIKASIRMFDASGIKYRKFEPKKKQIILKFE